MRYNVFLMSLPKVFIQRGVLPYVRALSCKGAHGATAHGFCLSCPSLSLTRSKFAVGIEMAWQGRG